MVCFCLTWAIQFDRKLDIYFLSFSISVFTILPISRCLGTVSKDLLISIVTSRLGGRLWLNSSRCLGTVSKDLLISMVAIRLGGGAVLG